MMTVEGISNLYGVLNADGDKSVTLRAVLLGAISKGETVIYNPLLSKDVLSAIECVKALGACVLVDGEKISITGAEKINDNCIFNCENSGTLARLLIGLLSGLGVNATIIGDESLSTRPMDRVCEPLKLRGGKIEDNNGHLPVKIYPAVLTDFEYFMPIDSAQVKSAIILSGITGKCETIIHEKNPTRDHTERMLMQFGADVNIENKRISIKKSELTGCEVIVPNDPSDAAFYVGMGLLFGEITVKRVMINGLRDGFYRVLKNANANIEYSNAVCNFYGSVADVTSKKCLIDYFEVSKRDIPTLIDEIPLLAIIAAFNNGCTIKDCKELRFKESDRLNGIVELLKLAGASARVKNDDLIVEGGVLPNAFNYGSNDHRMVMCAFILMSALKGGVLSGEEYASISFPSFFKNLQNNKLCLIGKDLSKSLSGVMHKHVLSELNQENFTYQMHSLNSEEADEFLKKLSYKAINATIPYKDGLFLASKEQSEASLICKCSNFLLNGTAHTTDGQGLLLALKYQGQSVNGKKVLVYGMGGAGRSIAFALKQAGAIVFVENRTRSKAVDFCKNVEGVSLYNGEDCDILINATPVVDEILFDKQKINQRVTVVDINYNKSNALLDYAKKIGASAYDGKDMLFFQAYIADCLLIKSAIDEEVAFNLYNKYKVKYEN